MSREEYADPEYMAGVIAHDWWMGEKAKARDAATTCRTALNFPDVTRVNGHRLHLESERAAFVAARVEALLDRAEALIADPTAYVDTDWGEVMAPEVALEEAHLSISRAWRVLMAAARNTRNARALARIAFALVRVARLRRRLAMRAPRPAGTRHVRARIARPAPLISLMQAAHGPPPRGGLSMSPQLAGGGPL